MDKIKAYFLDTESNLDIIKSVDFSLSNSLYFVNFDDDSIRKVKPVFEFNATFVSWENRGILIGTEKGGSVLVREHKIEHIMEKRQINRKDVKVIFSSINSHKHKLSSIKHVYACSNKRYIIIDSNHKGIFLSKNIKTISNCIETFKQSSEDTFVIRLQNYDKLIAINSFNDFASSPPPCFFLSQEKKDIFNEKIKRIHDNDNDFVDSVLNHIFITNKPNFSSSLRNSVQLLNKFISAHDPFNSVSSKIFLLLGNLEEARNLFLKMNPNDDGYLNNMVLAALYKSNSDSAKLIVKNFLANNLIDEAVDVLLMSKQIFSAAKILYKNRRNIDAYHVLMLYNCDNDYEKCKDIVTKVADSLINNNENVLFGLKLLSSFGYFQEMMNHLSSKIS